ncbi:hypothetical protein [Sciscionella marina]|uniref:hypothetical protein n=1 Tax=Sciscionella marina TaxID=508770 RepID=UPI00039CB568|nr:hypothetical protein [Sciscionella marina]
MTDAANTRARGQVLDNLFSHVLPDPANRSGRGRYRYTNEELAAFIREHTASSCSPQYISQLRKADRLTGVPHDKLEAMAGFFDVPAAVFFGDDNLAESVLAQIRLRARIADGTVDAREVRRHLRTVAAELTAYADGLDEEKP